VNLDRFCLTGKLLNNITELANICFRTNVKQTIQAWARFTKYLTYGYLTTMRKLRSTYDGRLVYQTSNEEREAFLKQDFLAKSQDLRR